MSTSPVIKTELEPFDFGQKPPDKIKHESGSAPKGKSTKKHAMQKSLLSLSFSPSKPKYKLMTSVVNSDDSTDDLEDFEHPEKKSPNFQKSIELKPPKLGQLSKNTKLKLNKSKVSVKKVIFAEYKPGIKRLESDDSTTDELEEVNSTVHSEHNIGVTSRVLEGPKSAKLVLTKYGVKGAPIECRQLKKVTFLEDCTEESDDECDDVSDREEHVQDVPLTTGSKTVDVIEIESDEEIESGKSKSVGLSSSKKQTKVVSDFFKSPRTTFTSMVSKPSLSGDATTTRGKNDTLTCSTKRPTELSCSTKQSSSKTSTRRGTSLIDEVFLVLSDGSQSSDSETSSLAEVERNVPADDMSLTQKDLDLFQYFSGTDEDQKPSDPKEVTEVIGNKADEMEQEIPDSLDFVLCELDSIQQEHVEGDSSSSSNSVFETAFDNVLAEKNRKRDIPYSSDDSDSDSVFSKGSPNPTRKKRPSENKQAQSDIFASPPVLLKRFTLDIPRVSPEMISTKVTRHTIPSDKSRLSTEMTADDDDINSLKPSTSKKSTCNTGSDPSKSSHTLQRQKDKTVMKKPILVETPGTEYHGRKAILRKGTESAIVPRPSSITYQRPASIKTYPRIPKKNNTANCLSKQTTGIIETASKALNSAESKKIADSKTHPQNPINSTRPIPVPGPVHSIRHVPTKPSRQHKMDDLYAVLLSWDPSLFLFPQEDINGKVIPPQLAMSDELTPVPDVFDGYDHYCDVFRPLFFHELWTNVSSLEERVMLCVCVQCLHACACVVRMCRCVSVSVHRYINECIMMTDAHVCIGV